MARCSCGAEITWLAMPTGRKMPVEAEPVPYWCPCIGGHTTLVLEVPGHGNMVVKGQGDMPPIFKVYAPHWANCPHADHYRKGGKHGNQKVRGKGAGGNA